MRNLVIGSVFFALSTTPAYALQPNPVEIKFSNLSTIAADGDLTVCQARYGDGYTTTPHKEKKTLSHKVSDQGHSIYIVKADVVLHHGVWVMNNQYEIVHPGSSDAQPTKAYVYTTSLTRNGVYSGVFSDRDCKGNVTISR